MSSFFQSQQQEYSNQAIQLPDDSTTVTAPAAPQRTSSWTASFACCVPLKTGLIQLPDDSDEEQDEQPLTFNSNGSSSNGHPFARSAVTISNSNESAHVTDDRSSIKQDETEELTNIARFSRSRYADVPDWTEMYSDEEEEEQQQQEEEQRGDDEEAKGYVINDDEIGESSFISNNTTLHGDDDENNVEELVSFKDNNDDDNTRETTTTQLIPDITNGLPKLVDVTVPNLAYHENTKIPKTDTDQSLLVVEEQILNNNEEQLIDVKKEEEEEEEEETKIKVVETEVQEQKQKQEQEQEQGEEELVVQLEPVVMNEESLTVNNKVVDEPVADETEVLVNRGLTIGDDSEEEKVVVSSEESRMIQNEDPETVKNIKETVTIDTSEQATTITEELSVKENNSNHTEELNSDNNATKKAVVEEVGSDNRRSSVVATAAQSILGDKLEDFTEKLAFIKKNIIMSIDSDDEEYDDDADNNNTILSHRKETTKQQKRRSTSNAPSDSFSSFFNNNNKQQQGENTNATSANKTNHRRASSLMDVAPSFVRFMNQIGSDDNNSNGQNTNTRTFSPSSLFSSFAGPMPESSSSPSGPVSGAAKTNTSNNNKRKEKAITPLKEEQNEEEEVDLVEELFDFTKVIEIGKNVRSFSEDIVGNGFRMFNDVANRMKSSVEQQQQQLQQQHPDQRNESISAEDEWMHNYL